MFYQCQTNNNNSLEDFQFQQNQRLSRCLANNISPEDFQLRRDQKLLRCLSALPAPPTCPQQSVSLLDFFLLNSKVPNLIGCIFLVNDTNEFDKTDFHSVPSPRAVKICLCFSFYLLINSMQHVLVQGDPTRL